MVIKLIEGGYRMVLGSSDARKLSSALCQASPTGELVRTVFDNGTVVEVLIPQKTSDHPSADHDPICEV
jgi:hypothetical protein